MNKFQVSSLPFKDVLKDIAQHLDVSVKESCSEFTLQLPESIGSGEIRGINFDNGLGILIYSCEFHEATTITFSVDKVHPVKFLYTLEGNIEHSFEKDSKAHDIEQYRCAMVASSGHNGHEVQFKANTPTTIISLEIDRKQFSERILCELDGLKPTLEALFKDYRAKNKFYHTGNYSLKFQELFEALSTYEDKKLIRKIFLESKALEIFVNQVIQFEDDMENGDNKTLLRQNEMVAIEKATQHIRDNLSNAMTVAQLAREIGINTNKLQNGFQYLHGKSVNQFLNDYRMELAVDFLTETDLSITEICEKIGISSRSYFSKKFKEHFKTQPSSFRDRRK